MNMDEANEFYMNYYIETIGDEYTNIYFKDMVSREDRFFMINGKVSTVHILKSPINEDTLVFYILTPERGDLGVLNLNAKENNFSFFYTDYPLEEKFYVEEGSLSMCGDGDYFCRVQYIGDNTKILESLNARLAKIILSIKEELLHG